MKHVLVTGAAGFIGQHLVRDLLLDQCRVRAMVRPGRCRPLWDGDVEVVEGDLLDLDGNKPLVAGVDTVFHLAGKAHALTEAAQDEVAYWSINFEGTRNLLDAIVAAGVTGFVFFSTVKVMGEETPKSLDESGEPRPVNAYGRSKLAAEQLVLEYGKRTGIHVVCLRLPLVYGPGNKGNFLSMISAIDRGIFPPLPNTGNRRSLVHVSNVVQAALRVATNSVANGQCYNVTDARPYSTSELYEMLCRGLAKEIPRWHTPVWALKGLAALGDAIGAIRGRRFMFDSDVLEKLIGSSWYSSEKITRDLGYRPSITFEQAVRDLIGWYRKSQA